MERFINKNCEGNTAMSNLLFKLMEINAEVEGVNKELVNVKRYIYNLYGGNKR